MRSPLADALPLTLSLALRLALALVLCLSLITGQAAPAAAFVPGLDDTHYLCGGDPLVAISDNGAVDAPDIPNRSQGTVPGAYVVLRWRGMTLQLPRTNNAGAPSYTDGKWWWSLENPDHPSFRLRRGGIETFPCERVS